LLIDTYGRKINYLRLSVTDRCNFRCFYCLSQKDFVLKRHDAILSYEQILKVAKIMSGLGVKYIKITGGEPLLRKGICEFVSKLTALPFKDVSLTTNGFYLEEKADGLKEAGLKRINISIDSLDKNGFVKITGFDGLSQVLRGIKKAKEAGFNPIKINAVALKGNKNQLSDFLDFASELSIQMRFIESMAADKSYFLSNQELIDMLGNRLTLMEESGLGPASYYCLDSNGIKVGFISPYSKKFCSSCNRLRLTADGYLKPCLFSDNKLNIKQLLDNGSTDKEIEDVIIEAVASKPKDHDFKVLTDNMNCIGG